MFYLSLRVHMCAALFTCVRCDWLVVNARTAKSLWPLISAHSHTHPVKSANIFCILLENKKFDLINVHLQRQYLFFLNISKHAGAQ